MRRQVNLSLIEGDDTFSLTLTRDRETGKPDQLLFTPPRMVWPADEQPRLHGGLRAHHLSVPLQVRRKPPHQGKLWTHLTYEDGHREELVAVDPNDIGATMRQFEALLCDRYREETFRVAPEELAEIGMEVWVPQPSLKVLLEEVVTNPLREYKLTSADFERATIHMRRESPMVLHEPWAKQLKQPLWADCAHIPGARLTVGYFPAWFDADVPGWFATPCPFVTDEDFLTILGRCMPSAFWDRMYIACRELQAPVDRAMLDRFRQGG